MRRAFCLGFFLAVAAGCTAFTAGVTPPGGTTPDGGRAPEAGTEAKPEGGAPPSTCIPQFQDSFARSTVVASPWRQLLAPDPTRVKIVGEALEIETRADAGSEKYMLTTGPFAAPKHLACTFTLTLLTDFATEDNKPIDVLVLVATAADGTSTQFHFGYFDGKLVVRDEHFDAQGQPCAGCLTGVDSKPVTIVKNEPTSMSLIMEDGVSQLGRSGDVVTHLVGLDGAVTTEISFGLWSSSPYAQQADLDNLQCSMACL